MSLADAPLDLSMTAFAEPGPGLLLATARMTTGRAVVAAAFGLAALACLYGAWRGRPHWLMMLWPCGLLAPAFAVIAVLLGFGRAEKSFDARGREASSKAGIGPLRFERRLSLPPQGVIRVTVRRERGSSAGGTAAKVTRWYDVDVGGQPALSFTVAGDRDAARSAARRLSALLGWPVRDEAEDDGVERL